MADVIPSAIPIRRVTLEDIAKKAGSHKSTVSLALRDSPLLKSETIEQIKRIARQLGYHPDPALARLAAHRWGHRPRSSGSDSEVIAFVVFPHQNKEVVERHFSSAKPVAEAHGFRLEQFHIVEYPRPERLLQVLRARGITGVMIAPLPPEATAFGVTLDWSEFTVVQCNLGWHRMPTLTATFNWSEAIRMAWKRAVDYGYHRIGPAIFAHEPWAAEDFDRFGAVKACQHGHPELPALPPLLSNVLDRAAFLKWHERHRPDAVISFHSEPHQWLVDAGVAVPAECGFVALNEQLDERICHTGGPVSQVGAAAMDLLLGAMRNHERGLPPVARLLLVSPVWGPGTSLPRRTAAPVGRRKRKTG
jgi:LacI family transcriptional regulator